MPAREININRKNSSGTVRFVINRIDNGRPTGIYVSFEEYVVRGYGVTGSAWVQDATTIDRGKYWDFDGWAFTAHTLDRKEWHKNLSDSGKAELRAAVAELVGRVRGGEFDDLLSEQVAADRQNRTNAIRRRRAELVEELASLAADARAADCGGVADAAARAEEILKSAE